MKLKHYFSLLLVFCLFASNSFAQSFTDNTTTSISNEKETIHSLGLGMSGLGYSIEHKFNNKFSAMGSVGCLAAWGYYGINGYRTTYYSISPAISVEGRYYYNLEKRLRKGKSIRANSGSFWAMSLSYMFKPILEKNIIFEAEGLVLSPYWGLRRLWWNTIIFEFKVGLNLYYPNFDKKLYCTPLLGVGFHYKF